MVTRVEQEEQQQLGDYAGEEEQHARRGAHHRRVSPEEDGLEMCVVATSGPATIR